MSTIKLSLKEYNNNAIINISGSKNAALPIIASSILSDEIIYLNNIPNIEDVHIMLRLLDCLKVKNTYINNTLIIYPKKKIHWKLNADLTNKLRGSYYFFGTLLSKKSKAQIKNIGGCKLGERPINYHLKAFQEMGYHIYQNNEETKIKGKLKHSIINLEYPSVGTTINIILAAIKNKRKIKTIINNASFEPEVVDLCNFLKSMGAQIQGISSPNLMITSVKYLHSSNYTIISDRIEAGTFLILGALHNGITIKNANTKHLQSLIEKLESIGCLLYEHNKLLYLKPNKTKSLDITTNVFPSFPTDLAPQMSVLASQCPGFSTITETVYKERFSHISELRKLNIEIIKNENISYIKGKQKINYNDKILNCKDLRQGAALVLASSLSDKEVTISNTHFIDRGYEDFYAKLEQLGFIIKKENRQSS